MAAPSAKASGDVLVIDDDAILRDLVADWLLAAGYKVRKAADCKAVMHHLGVARAHLVGQSYGGVILLQLALDTPDAVHTLSLLEPALGRLRQCRFAPG